MADLLATQFQECSWRGVSFPIEMVGEKGGQRLAIHHKMDRDGAQVEGTGRMPYSFSIKAFFLDSLMQGTNESWRDLFPQTWLQVRSDLERKDTGIFVHPFYGNVNCKVVNWSANFTSEVRNGVIVEMDFIETIDDVNGAVNLQPSVISAATSAAINLQEQIVLSKTKNTITTSSSSLVDQVSAAINSVLLQTVGKVDSLISGVYNFMNKIINEGNFIASLFDACYQLIDALNTLRLEFQFKDKQTAIYTVAFDTTLVSIAGFLGNSIENIMNLNPKLITYAIVPRGTKVVYYSL